MYEILCQYIEVFSNDDIFQDNSWSAVSIPISSIKKCLFRKLTHVLARSQLASARLSLKLFQATWCFRIRQKSNTFQGTTVMPLFEIITPL